jgi:hypothetical protein
MKGIAEWLASIGLSEYAQRSADNAIDLSVVRDLRDLHDAHRGARLNTPTVLDFDAHDFRSAPASTSDIIEDSRSSLW